MRTDLPQPQYRITYIANGDRFLLEDGDGKHLMGQQDIDLNDRGVPNLQKSAKYAKKRPNNPVGVSW